MVANPSNETARSGDAERASDGRAERWRAHRQTRRRALMAAVVEAVRAGGPDVGMDDIAAHSGIAKQVFYRYFADKADMRVAVGRSVARGVVRDVTRAIEEQADIRAMLAAGIDRYLSLIAGNIELYRFVVAGAGSSGGRHRHDDTDIVADFETVLGVQVARLIGDRLRAQGRDAGAAEPWGFALVGATRAAADRWLAAPTMSREALAAHLTEFAWNGLSVIGDADDAAADTAEVQTLAVPSLTDSRRRRAR